MKKISAFVFVLLILMALGVLILLRTEITSAQTTEVTKVAAVDLQITQTIDNVMPSAVEEASARPTEQPYTLPEKPDEQERTEKIEETAADKDSDATDSASELGARVKYNIITKEIDDGYIFSIFPKVSDEENVTYNWYLKEPNQRMWRINERNTEKLAQYFSIESWTSSEVNIKQKSVLANGWSVGCRIHINDVTLFVKETEYCPDKINEIFREQCVHDYVFYRGISEGTCVSAGREEYRCTKCANTIEKDYLTNPYNHEGQVSNGICTACGKQVQIESCSHEWDMESVVMGTCISDGKIVERCILCGQAETTELGPDYSNHAGDISSGTCSACGQVFVDPEICSHVFEYVPELSLPATCTEFGLSTSVCSKCYTAYIEVIPLDGHEYVTTIVQQGNCVIDTIQESICMKCGDTRREVLGLMPHWIGDNGKCEICGISIDGTYDSNSDAIEGGISAPENDPAVPENQEVQETLYEQNILSDENALSSDSFEG